MDFKRLKEIVDELTEIEEELRDYEDIDSVKLEIVVDEVTEKLINHCKLER